MLGNVRLSSERLEDTPPSSEILTPSLLLDDTGALFKFCRFMEVEGNVLFKIRRMKALVSMSKRKQ